MDTSSFKEAGLTDGEIKVYLALLEVGSSTTGPIIEKSGVSRSIIYQILEKLMQKGLTSMIIKEKTKHFQATQPSKLLEYIDERAKKLQDNRGRVEKLLPELFLKQTLASKSEATFYTGFKGIRTGHEHIYTKLKKGEEYCYLGIPAYQPKEQHIYWQKDRAKSAKLGIRSRLLFNKGTDPKVLKNRNSYKGCDARYMPTPIKTPAAFLIYKDTVMIHVQSPKPIAIEIINEDIANSFKAYFEEFWRRTKPYNQKNK